METRSDVQNPEGGITETKGGSLVAGEIPKGCRFCIRGAKMVVFVTGECGVGCYYCPLSFKRRDNKQGWANERPILDDQDIIEEAERMRAEGASITGGEPLLEPEKTPHYIRLLKEKFGKNFHIHLYTFGHKCTPELAKKLSDAGLDEIRFHSNFHNLEQILKAKLPIDAGAEVPCIPGSRDNLFKLVDLLEGMGAMFLNLNEFDFSEGNVEALKKMGLETRAELSYGVAGSEELAKEVLAYARNKNLSVHYCPSRLKDSVQFRNRLIRTANNVRKKFEKVNGDGLLVKGAIETDGNLENERDALSKKYSIPNGYLQVDAQKKRIETSASLAETLSNKLDRKKYRVLLIEEFPTWDRYEAESTPL